MDKWDTESTAEREHAPIWLVDFCQIWTADSSAKYQEEYKKVRKLAQQANVPPFVIMIRMFRDTYHLTTETTKEEFILAADSGQMLLHLATVQLEDTQKLIQQLEERTAEASLKMREAIDANDDLKFEQALQTFVQSQEAWLIVSQNMTPEKARAVMVGFATGGEINTWMEQQIPGPPPCIFSLYKK